MSDMVELARRAAEYLQGTPQSIHDLGPEFDAAQHDKEFCAELDQLVFSCYGCGWWCEISEMSDVDQHCNDCEPDNDDEL